MGKFVVGKTNGQIRFVNVSVDQAIKDSLLENENEVDESFWIKKSLKHRGIIAGKYKLIKNIEKKGIITIEELEKPHLIDQKTKMYPVVDASEDVSEDIERLLQIGVDSYNKNNKTNWKEVLPIYPTSPVKIN